jgi:histidyl-tRNA synthetase
MTERVWFQRMSTDKTSRPKARLPRGFRDRGAAEIAAERACLETIARVYESYGFEPLETPAFEYTDALGKFLPDVDRPNEGVFSLQDDDKQWLSLRYDLTAPLARYVAENFQNLPKPFRRYQVGPVWRNEKPGPGRYREFTQFDADTVGSASSAADAELVMMACDALEAVGLKRGEYIVKINNRKLLDGYLDSANIDRSKRGAVLRAIDKFDRLGVPGVFQLLTTGRIDQSGDKMEGVGLSAAQAYKLIAFTGATIPAELLSIAKEEGIEQIQIHESLQTLEGRKKIVGSSNLGITGAEELAAIIEGLEKAGYGPDRVQIDTSIIRGLEYYTGAVFEAQLTFPVSNDAGETIVFGSVVGGGRYDDLIARFTGQTVPGVGISIGVSRLLTALKSRNSSVQSPLIVVLALDNVQSSFAIAAELRGAGYRAETYVGTRKFGDQLKYADRRGAAIAVIEGSDERAKGEITLKDLALGAELAKSVESRAAWVKDRPAQKSIARADLVREIRAMLGKD